MPRVRSTAAPPRPQRTSSQRRVLNFDDVVDSVSRQQRPSTGRGAMMTRSDSGGTDRAESPADAVSTGGTSVAGSEPQQEPHPQQREDGRVAAGKCGVAPEEEVGPAVATAQEAARTGDKPSGRRLFSGASFGDEDDAAHGEGSADPAAVLRASTTSVGSATMRATANNNVTSTPFHGTATGARGSGRSTNPFATGLTPLADQLTLHTPGHRRSGSAFSMVSTDSTDSAVSGSSRGYASADAGEGLVTGGEGAPQAAPSAVSRALPFRDDDVVAPSTLRDMFPSSGGIASSSWGSRSMHSRHTSCLSRASSNSWDTEAGAGRFAGAGDDGPALLSLGGSPPVMRSFNMGAEAGVHVVEDDADLDVALSSGGPGAPIPARSPSPCMRMPLRRSRSHIPPRRGGTSLFPAGLESGGGEGEPAHEPFTLARSASAQPQSLSRARKASIAAKTANVPDARACGAGMPLCRARSSSAGTAGSAELASIFPASSSRVSTPKFGLDCVDESKVCDSPTLLPPPQLSRSPTQPLGRRARTRKRILHSGPDMLSPTRSVSAASGMSAASANTAASFGSFSSMVSTSCDSVESAQILDTYVASQEGRPKTLPTVDSHDFPDLNVISVDTLEDLLAGKFANVAPKYHIVDCRYPYEYEGGHIRGAQNIPDPETLVERFMNEPQLAGGAPIIIFHCEFSHNRAPKMYRFLRNQDRKVHAATYPELYYPELYLVNKGYKNVFHQKPSLCEPPTYTEMLDVRFRDEQAAARQMVKRSYRTFSNKRQRSSQRRTVRHSCPASFALG